MRNPTNTFISKSNDWIKRYSRKTTCTYSWKWLKHHCATHSKIHYIHSSSLNAQTVHEIDAESYEESNQYIYIEIKWLNQTIFTKNDMHLLMKMNRRISAFGFAFPCHVVQSIAAMGEILSISMLTAASDVQHWFHSLEPFLRSLHLQLQFSVDIRLTHCRAKLMALLLRPRLIALPHYPPRHCPFSSSSFSFTSYFIPISISIHPCPFIP